MRGFQAQHVTYEESVLDLSLTTTSAPPQTQQSVDSTAACFACFPSSWRDEGILDLLFTTNASALRNRSPPQQFVVRAFDKGILDLLFTTNASTLPNPNTCP